MSQKILIAHRGEIALRAIRACKELNLNTVAIYSTGDKDQKHLRFADETVCIGSENPMDSYLNIPSILSAAELSQTDAIYPGYGFLSEDHNFAERCQNSGFKFIGPSSKVIEIMGDKISAKKLVSQNNIPVVPGYDEKLPKNQDEINEIANSIGFPLIIKASAGGGGRGMRIVRDYNELSTGISLTKQEAKNAFGNDAIYLEKYIENPRHIEVQVVGDGQGSAIHLGTRDCSLQRKHQKIIEEAPAIDIDEDALNIVLKSCVDLCKKIKYEGVGTIEFLYKDGSFFFIEMNTRIQVEHPVTEMVTMFDLVKTQLKLALGMKMKLDQKRVSFKGHAIECRINAEDPLTFLPSPGLISKMHPPGGFGVRFDSHIYSGYLVPPYYDSLLAKIITAANSRRSSIKRMISALEEFFVEGINTNHSLHQKILFDEIFLQNKHHVNYLEDEFLEKIKDA